MTQDQSQAAAAGAERKTASNARGRLDEKLDEALEATFPASDPIALTDPADTATPERVTDG
jgi:hypothetical protein